LQSGGIKEGTSGYVLGASGETGTSFKGCEIEDEIVEETKVGSGDLGLPFKSCQIEEKISEGTTEGRRDSSLSLGEIAIKQVKSEDKADGSVDRDLSFNGGGIMVRLLTKVFKFIDRPWKMYPLGVLFGLGFDTSSEIAVLGIASIQAIGGTSIWLILIFPLLFTGKILQIPAVASYRGL
jgi:hypothetical protein